MKTRLMATLFTCLLTLALAEPAFAERKTRDLVFEDEDNAAAATSEVAKKNNIANPVTISVKTALDLTRDGQTSSVEPNYEFKSGDRVKLRYTTNADGYVYWLAKMSSGKYSVLFPNNQTGMNNLIKKNEEHTVPVKGSFRFDDKPGTENLLMVFSPDRIPELEQAVVEANGQKNNVLENSTQIASVEEKNISKRKTRDLVFEDEDEEEVNTKTQVAPKGEPFVAMYELIHK
jgi:hypothetical protein